MNLVNMNTRVGARYVVSGAPKYLDEYKSTRIDTPILSYKPGITLFATSVDVDNGADTLSYSLEYDESSTKDNPKIKVIGKYTGSKKEYLEVITLKDIDLSNASKFELEAIHAHLRKVDKQYKDVLYPYPTSTGLMFEFGKRYDMLGLYKRDISVYREGGWYDLSLRTQRALDSILDFLKKMKYKQ